MALQTKTKKTHKTPKTIGVIIIIILLLIGGYFAYAVSNDIWPFAPHDRDSITTTPTSKNNLQKASKDDSKKKQDESELIQQGGNEHQGSHSTDGTGITDTHGQDVKKQSGGTASQSGDIVLYTPKPDQTVKSGVVIKGAASVSTVQYRIADPIHGQTGQGTLSVHDGYFSGTLHIQGTDAKHGTIEFYSFNRQGQEINNVRIDVNF